MKHMSIPTSSAMAVAAAVSVYSTAFASVSDCFRWGLFGLTILFIGASLLIEWMHVQKE
jgi:hypothetical protein